MKFNISRWTAALVAIPTSIVTGLASMLALDLHLFFDLLVGTGGFFAAYFPTQSVSFNRQLREYGLNKSEYKYIRSQLKEAKEKMNRLRQSYYNIRTLKDAKLIFDINRIVKSIVTTVEDDPKVFYNVQQFFHSNLDSAVNTIEQYLFLYRMPGKSKEEKIKLHETRLSMLELKRTLQSNLSHMNRPAYQSLEVEKDLISLNRKRAGRNMQLENKMDEQKVNISDQEREEVSIPRQEREKVKVFRSDNNESEK
ncbi:5-bromo-4-chloroindolyl phosphate hydrolysis family protein [Salinicoccus halitifaciens]|uniref:5-bromo-4-chloroindolyl phosphate hydrolysis protein n=1 Tax=Salinicoccus halitifaciens TaxID=1073415 RepID=A0ABV2E684_9STAP|nr:5-bromo-4-chloroindolyl phosphate hydrolysis family protein [Salinicoccus halitifaciens]MCD2137020.1 5-bromo-4-chloroindolyl phosphate hydrolysis family protein [Salinicoccus halitifaciens]